MAKWLREMGPFALAVVAAGMIVAILLVLYTVGMVYFGFAGPAGPGSGGGHQVVASPAETPAPITISNVAVPRAVSVLVTADATWVGTFEGPSGAVVRLDDEEQPVATIEIGEYPADMHAVGSSIWLLSVGESLLTSLLVEIDPQTDTKVRSIRVPGGAQLAAGADRLWTLVGWPGRRVLERRDPATGLVEAQLPLHGAEEVVAGESIVWVLATTPADPAAEPGPKTHVVRVDATTMRILGSTQLPHPGADRLAVAGDGSAWVITQGNEAGSLTQVAVDGAIQRVVPLPGGDGGPQAIATGPAAVWVGHIDGSVYRIDESTGRPVAGTVLRPVPEVVSLAVGHDEVWVVGWTSLVRIGR